MASIDLGRLGLVQVRGPLRLGGGGGRPRLRAAGKIYEHPVLNFLPDGSRNPDRKKRVRVQSLGCMCIQE